MSRLKNTHICHSYVSYKANNRPFHILTNTSDLKPQMCKAMARFIGRHGWYAESALQYKSKPTQYLNYIIRFSLCRLAHQHKDWDWGHALMARVRAFRVTCSRSSNAVFSTAPSNFQTAPKVLPELLRCYGSGGWNNDYASTRE